MTTKEFINYVEASVCGDDFFVSESKKLKKADQLTRDGYGQSNRKGGYLKSFETWKKQNNIPQEAQATQYWHMINSWGKLDNPQILRLKCPQLMLYIAEVCGWNETNIDNAINEIKQYEDSRGLKCSSCKGGNYLEKKGVGENVSEAIIFKESLKYYHLCKIIDESTTLDEIKSKVRPMKDEM